MYIKSFKIQSCPERFDLYGDYRARRQCAHFAIDESK